MAFIMDFATMPLYYYGVGGLAIRGNRGGFEPVHVKYLLPLTPISS